MWVQVEVLDALRGNIGAEPFPPDITVSVYRTMTTGVCLLFAPSQSVNQILRMLRTHRLSRATLFLRNYSTRPLPLSTKRPSRLSQINKPPLSLDHFLLRQRVLALYRTIIRTCHKLPSPTREELRHYAREEFEQRREVTELRQVRYLLSTGKAEYERMRGQVGGAGR
jgi:hypothetical protein